jgi:4a-hydroxytetrahydrobiopterin dehydratase
MSDLHLQTCDACRADAPQVSETELAGLIGEIPDWQPVTENNIMKLRREFMFGDFAQALAFTNKVGALAESVGHHPEIITEWGKTTVTWWTHKINGLHKTDFICAARTDRLIP